jgi:type IV fimbrial biogenesis protein FimT
VLEPLMMSGIGHVIRTRGFTLIELIVTIAVAGVLLSLVIPSFQDLLAKQRVEGLMSELGTDLQFARSEAVTRNSDVRVTFGSGCYVIHTQPTGVPASTCSQSAGVASVMGAASGVSAVEIKTTKVTGTQAAVAGDGGMSFIQFEPVRGAASWDTAASSASVSVTSASGAWQLRALVSESVGRLRVCSPNASLKGYSASCT